MDEEDRENNERDILIERATMGLGRNLLLVKSPEFTRMTPAKTPSIGGKGTCTGFPL